MLLWFQCEMSPQIYVFELVVPSWRPGLGSCGTVRRWSLTGGCGSLCCGGRRGLTLLEVFRLSLHFLSVLCLLLVGVTSCLLLPPHLTHHDGLHALEL